MEIGPNAPIPVVEFESFASSLRGLLVALLVHIEPAEIGVGLIVGRKLNGFLKCRFCSGRGLGVRQLHVLNA